jgi:hypothetical protein
VSLLHQDMALAPAVSLAGPPAGLQSACSRLARLDNPSAPGRVDDTGPGVTTEQENEERDGGLTAHEGRGGAVTHTAVDASRCEASALACCASCSDDETDDSSSRRRTTSALAVSASDRTVARLLSVLRDADCSSSYCNTHAHKARIHASQPRTEAVTATAVDGSAGTRATCSQSCHTVTPHL